jgi:hypothetical protein
MPDANTVMVCASRKEEVSSGIELKLPDISNWRPIKMMRKRSSVMLSVSKLATESGWIYVKRVTIADLRRVLQVNPEPIFVMAMRVLRTLAFG